MGSACSMPSTIDAAHVVGASMGGMIAQTMAIEHPDRVRSLTSMMSSPGDPRTGKPEPEALEVLLTVPPSDRAAYIDAASRTAVWASKRYVDIERIRRPGGRELRPQLLPRGRAAPARRDLRQRRPHRCPRHARRPRPRDPRPRRHVDHAGRGNGDGRGDPRRPPSARRRHGPRPAAAAVAADRVGDPRRHGQTLRSRPRPCRSDRLLGWRRRRMTGAQWPRPLIASSSSRHRAGPDGGDAARRHGCRGDPGRAGGGGPRPGARRRRTSTSRCAAAATWPSTSSSPTAWPCCSTSSSGPTP